MMGWSGVGTLEAAGEYKRAADFHPLPFGFVPSRGTRRY
jgi:hypothetical protein